MRTPFYGRPKMTAYLRRLGYAVNGKRVWRLMRLIGIQAIYPERSGSSPGQGHKRYPYLCNLPITHFNQVWSADFTSAPLLRGFTYQSDLPPIFVPPVMLVRQARGRGRLRAGPNLVTLKLSNTRGSNHGGSAFAFRAEAADGTLLEPRAE